MTKRTLYFGNPAHLSTRLEQLLIAPKNTKEKHQVPIEDIGVMIIDHPQITFTQSVMAKLLEHNVALITCNATHHPTGLMLNLDGHTKQSKLFKHQLEASEPLKKRLWQTCIKAKIHNQALLLQSIGAETLYLQKLAQTVKSGDTDHHEAQAAQYYWKHYFHALCNTRISRERFGSPPNHLLNYGYAILRALVARHLVGSGLLPTLGIFHRNQYNAYCLADDMMESYRPFVDQCVLHITQNEVITDDIPPAIKKQLLQIPVIDVKIGNKIRPLMLAVQETTASLARSFEQGKNLLRCPTYVEST